MPIINKKAIAPIVIAGLVIAVAGAAQFLHGRLYYAHVVVEAQDNLKLEFLQQGRPKAEDCRSATAAVAGAIKASCPACRVTLQHCPSKLEAEYERLLSEMPVALPTSRLPDNGVVAYSSANESFTLAACREAERLAGASQGIRVTCYPPNTARPLPGNAQPRRIESGQAIFSFLILVLSGLASAFAGYLIVHYDALHARWSHDPVASGPHKFHATPTPRIGGLCLFAGLGISGVVLDTIQQPFSHDLFDNLLLAGVPAFLGGLTEDVTKKVGVATRLLLTMLAAACGAWLLGAIIPRLDVAGLDTLLMWTPFAIVFTIFTVGGVANAINIIDGYNGLAAGCAVIVLAALAVVSARVGDTFLLTSSLAMAGALLGFLFWNYPKGKIFLGDGGAYLLGFWLAELSVLLVVRHPEVSPWFPLLLLAYPIFETLFSIYRKKFLRGRSPGQPESLHSHMLIYKRLIRSSASSREHGDLTRRNSAVAAYVWAVSAMCALPALVFWDETPWLVAFSLLFSVCYVWLYRRITHWKTPKWIIRTG